MKYLLMFILAVAAATGYSQTNNVSTNSSWWGDIVLAVKESGVAQATNYAFEPYATYAPDVPKGKRIGGGALVVYNINDYVGAGIGVDYLGRFSLLSANVTLKVPVQPFKSFGPSWLRDVSTTPFVLGGVGTPLGGSDSSVTAIADVGAFIGFGHLWGGQFNVGACYGKWANADPYSGVRYHAFAGWSKGF